MDKTETNENLRRKNSRIEERTDRKETSMAKRWKTFGILLLLLLPLLLVLVLLLVLLVLGFGKREKALDPIFEFHNPQQKKNRKREKGNQIINYLIN